MHINLFSAKFYQFIFGFSSVNNIILLFLIIMCNVERFEQALTAFVQRLCEEEKQCCQITRVAFIPRLGYLPDVKLEFVITPKDNVQNLNDLNFFAKSSIRLMEAAQDEIDETVICFTSSKSNKFSVVIRPQNV